MEIKVRVLNSNDKEKKKGNEFRESLKVLTPQYVRELNKDVTARIRESEARHRVSAKDVEDGFFR